MVFVSYAREDEKWRRRFEVMLKPLTAKGLVVWSDARIAVGQVWRAELERAIVRADAALVLVSPDLLASEFVMGEELPALRARGIPLALVHVRASLAGQVDALADVQWAHDLARPLQAAEDPDAEIVRICEWFADLLPARVPHDASALTDDGHERETAKRVPRLVPTGRMGDLHGVPAPATGEIERVELVGLREAVLGDGEGAVGTTCHSRAVGLHGQGGVGKSVLAAALARDSEVRRHFPGGVYWVTVGERGDLVALQLALLERLGAARPQLRSRESAAAALRDTLDQRRCLLVVDDVWTAAAAAGFDVTGPLGRVLYTTRDERVLEAVGAQVRRVDVLPEDAARALLASLARERVDALPAAADRVLAATGGVALALALIGAAIGRGGRDWDEVAAELEDARKTFRDHPYADVFKAMQISVATLEDQLAAAYHTLAVYPQDDRVPVMAIARLWAHIEAAGTPKQTRLMLKRLAERELLVLDGDTVSFHDLQHEFLLLRAGDMRLAHDELLASYQALLPTDDPHWHRLPPGEPYIWEHLFEHLRGASDISGLHAVATDLAYLATRCARDGPYAVETDLRAAARLHPGDAAIDWTINVFTRWGHLLTVHETPGEVAVALAIRAQDLPAPLDVGALRALTDAPLLVSRWGLPDAPAELLRILEGHTGSVSAVVFSADGGLLASASRDRTVRLWAPASGQPIRILKGHTDPLSALAFSPDGRLLASAGEQGMVWWWDSASGQRNRTLRGHPDRVSA
ncbi:MAG: TIR domain-containing protein, partial [Actinobacteria bacterium]|nr:TIR domain-containing protein [Actinomycetota bacterium]